MSTTILQPVRTARGCRRSASFKRREGIFESAEFGRWPTLKLNVVRPKGVKGKLPVFIFIHGGGWVLGDYPTHKRMVRDLVVLSGLAGVFVNYTRTPDARYPQAVNEIYAATKWVAEHGEEIQCLDAGARKAWRTPCILMIPGHIIKIRTYESDRNYPSLTTNNGHL